MTNDKKLLITVRKRKFLGEEEAGDQRKGDQKEIPIPGTDVFIES